MTKYLRSFYFAAVSVEKFPGATQARDIGLAILLMLAPCFAEAAFLEPRNITLERSYSWGDGVCVGGQPLFYATAEACRRDFVSLRDKQRAELSGGASEPSFIVVAISEIAADAAKYEGTDEITEAQGLLLLFIVLAPIFLSTPNAQAQVRPVFCAFASAKYGTSPGAPG